MKSLVLSSLIVVAALCSRAEEFHWNESGSGNWSVPSRWTLADGSAAARAPGEGDVAVISGVEALVTDDDQSVISLIGEIQLKDDESVVNFANKRDFTLACPVRGKGLIVKSENGKLFLAACKKYLASDGTSASASLGDHFTDRGMRIEAGWVVAPQSSGSGKSHICRLEILDDGVFQMINDNTQIFVALKGTGTVTNAVPATTWQEVKFGRRYNNDIINFAGKFKGTKLNAGIWGRCRLTGTESTITGNAVGMSFHEGYPNKGTLELARFGLKGGASSIGEIERINMTYSGRLHYLGSGETTDKTITYRAQQSARNIIDAGAVGGVDFAGTIEQVQASDCLAMARLELTGSNTIPCVISGQWKQNTTSGGTNFATYVTKTGKGTWRLGHNEASTHRGAFAVEEGTLQFDSIAPTNVPSALGLSSVLYKDIGGIQRLDENKVDYALLLGGATTNVVLEYTGSQWCSTSSRKIELKGTVSRVRCSSLSGGVSLLGGTYARDAGEKTLVLDGDGTGGAMGNISDGKGRVNVVKEGAGTWKLMRNQTFSGRLDVREGELIVSNAKELYRWFRLNVLDAGENEGQRHWGEWVLYDKEGKRCNLNMRGRYPSNFDPAATDYTFKNISNDFNWQNLRPGETCFSSPQSFLMYVNEGYERLFDNDAANKMFRWYYYPTKRFSLVLRLAQDAGEVASFDFCPYLYGTATMNSYSIEASPNGEDWTMLRELSGVNSQKGKFHSDGTDWSASHVPDTQEHPEFALEGGMKGEWSVLSNVTAVTVASGATLRAEGDVTLPTLEIDCAKAGGTVAGFRLGEKGVVSLLNVGKDTEDLPIVLTGCVALENIEKWPVSVNGKINPKRKVVVANGALRLCRDGLSVIVR